MTTYLIDSTFSKMETVEATVIRQYLERVMFKKVELEGGYSVCVENDIDKQKTMLGVAGWQLMFTSKDDVREFISMLEKAMEFWEYD